MYLINEVDFINPHIFSLSRTMLNHWVLLTCALGAQVKVTTIKKFMLNKTKF